MEQRGVSEEYADTNGNGIPDAFENRPPLTEMLNGTSETRRKSPSPSVVASILDLNDPVAVDEARTEYRRLENAARAAIAALEAFKAKLRR